MSRKISRRKFLKMAGMAGIAAGATMAVPWKFGIRDAYAFYQSSGIPLYGTTLRGIGTIGVAAPDTMIDLVTGLTVNKPAPVTGVTHYTITIDQYADQITPTGIGLGPTTLRGFNPVNRLAGQANKHLSGIIVGQKGSPIQITFKNNLPAGMHIIPNDLTIPMPVNQANNRIAVHFHGGLVPWISDGGPHDWWMPDGTSGLSFLNNATLNPSAAPNEAEYYYGLNQSARFGWYHDHAWGITRINAYAGIATGLIIRDNFEKGLVDGSGGVAQGLPNYIEAGGNEIPLVFQDKIFVGTNIAAMDPTWANVVNAAAQTPGSLWYAHIYEKNRWKMAGAGKLAPPDPSAIPEFFGDTMLVNGTTSPVAAVEPRRYRLRMLNACNARFLNLQFYIADASATGITLNAATGNPTNLAAGVDPNTAGAASVLQIGTEGGFLPKPATIPTNIPFNPVALTGSLIVAPAERPDLIIDFSACAGKSVIVYNDAPAPFPVGDPRNDYFPNWNVKGNPANMVAAGQTGLTNPNSRILMRFDVAPLITGAADLPLTINTATNLASGIDAPLIPFGSSTVPGGVPVRQLTLNENFDAWGRLQQLLGTLVYPGKSQAGYGRAYMDPPTENITLDPVTGAYTEVWEIFNTTADVHPMHFHLVNVQVINRQPFNVSSINNGVPTLTGVATPPNPNETGWKETVMMFPGQVTRIIMKFELPKITGPDGVTPITTVAGTLPGQLAITNGMPPVSPRTGGNEYVWHCHILEHEEHDMMRPLVVF